MAAGVQVAIATLITNQGGQCQLPRRDGPLFRRWATLFGMQTSVFQCARDYFKTGPCHPWRHDCV